MPIRHCFFILLTMFCSCGLMPIYAQLVVNELSQGSSGNKEYVELVVNGTASCANTCSDIRGWMFDDNNGWYGTSAISPGCYRFKDDANWSCVPYGSIIVIYNNGDQNTSLPGDDPTDANNDGVYVLPITSNYLELHNTLPASGSMTYPSSGFGVSTTWTNMALNNSSDAIQVIDPANLTVAYHAVSYGNNITAPVHINASGGQKVYFLNGDQYNQSAAWVAGDVPVDETPGAPNNAANALWINNLLNGNGGGVSSNDTFAAGICQGDSLLFAGVYRSAPGFFTHTFVSSAGCDSLITLNLSVSPVPVVPGVVTPLVYCQGEVVGPLNAVGIALLWYDSVAGGNGSTAAPTPTTNNPGNQVYYVSQTVGGCESGRSTIDVVVNPHPLPPLMLQDSIVLCQGSPAYQLTAQGQNLLWYNQPVGGLGSANAPIVNTDIGLVITHYVSQTINGCESDRLPITTRVSVIQAAFNLAVDSLCISDSLLTENLSIGSEYSSNWDFGDGLNYTAFSPAHLYQQPGIYTVRLVLTNSDGCRDTAQKRIWVSPVPNISVTLDKYHLCTGDEVEFTLKYIRGFSFFTWDFGDGNKYEQNEIDWDSNRGNITEMLIRHSYDTEGTYFFATSAYTPGCGSLGWQDSVNIYPLPKVNLGPDRALCLRGTPIPLSNEFPLSLGESYLWSTGESSAEIMARHHGDISLTVSNAYCSNTDVVTINKDCYIDVPNAFTPNNDGNNDYFFPRQQLSSSLTYFKMQIFNRWGQLVFASEQTNGRGWDGKLNNTDQPGGVYIYLIDVVFSNGTEESYQGNVTLLR